jgi:micrococcal nuclease
MPIIFEDYRRKRFRRRIALTFVLVLAIAVGLLAGTRLVAPQRVASSIGGNSQSRDSAPVLFSSQRPQEPPAAQSTRAPVPAALTSAGVSCSVVDGDTLHCNGERIRLLGVDAPELPGHCRIGRHCVPGDPFAASSALETAVRGGDLQISAVGTDRYGRTLANIYAHGRNISCALIRQGSVQYIERWDNGRLVARDCPELSL